MRMEKKNTEQMPSFAEQVERIVNEDSFSLSNSHLLMGQTPEILEQFGFDISLPMLVSQNKVRNKMCIRDSYYSIIQGCDVQQFVEI